LRCILQRKKRAKQAKHTHSLEYKQSGAHATRDTRVHNFPSSENPAAGEDRAESEDYQMKEFVLNCVKDAHKPETIVGNTKEDSTNNLSARNGNRIYIRSTRRWVPVSETYYVTYMREVGAFKKRQYRHGFCMCPGTKEYMCDCDCLTCPFYKKDAIMSLDAPIMDDEGNEETLMDHLVEEDTMMPEEVVLEKDEHESLYRAIEELCEEDQILIRMTLAEKPQIEIAEALGLRGQTNVAKRKRRALKALREGLAEYE